MSYLDKFNDNDFDIEDKLAYLEEANNFYSEASRQEALRLAQQGAAIYDKASTTNKDAKKFKKSSAYASRIAEKNNRFYDLDQADAELQDNKNIYGKYDKKRARAMSLEVSRKLAPLEDEINSQKQYVEDLMSQAYDTLAASGEFNIFSINRNLKHLRKGSLGQVDRRMVGILGSGFMDLVAKTQKHLISLDEQRKDIIKKAKYVKSKEGYTANANKIIQDSAKAKERAMNRYRQIEHVDQVNADAKTPDKMKVKNGQTLSEYQKRSIKKAYAANELEQEKKDRKELEKSAKAGGFKQNKIYADDTKGRLMQKYAAGRLGVNKDGSRKPLPKIQQQPTQQRQQQQTQAQPTQQPTQQPKPQSRPQPNNGGTLTEEELNQALSERNNQQQTQSTQQPKPNDVVYCQWCGAENKKGSKFCVGCKAPLNNYQEANESVGIKFINHLK